MRQDDRGVPLIVFDLDGVITTEQIYWESARLTIWELVHLTLRLPHPYVSAVHDGLARAAYIPDALIASIKARAINSNWDLTYLVACGVLLGLPAHCARGATSVADVFGAARRAGSAARTAPDFWWVLVLSNLLAQISFDGHDLLVAVGEQTASHLGLAQTDWFQPGGLFWQALYERFQNWYGGHAMGAWGAERLQEFPVLPPAQLQRALEALRVRGAELAIATGRPRSEAEYALSSFGILDQFDRARMITYDDVARAQTALQLQGLGKPHPFVIRKAIWPDLPDEVLLQARQVDRVVWMVGDSPSDCLAAASAGVPCIGVASAADMDAERHARHVQALHQAGCERVIDDISTLAAILWADESQAKA